MGDLVCTFQELCIIQSVDGARQINFRERCFDWKCSTSLLDTDRSTIGSLQKLVDMLKSRYSGERQAEKFRAGRLKTRDWKTRDHLTWWGGNARLENALWRQWDSLVLKDGVLYRQGKQRRRPVLQLLVPASKRAEFIAECHQNTNGGHRAFRTTLGRVRRKGFWMGWLRDVESYCCQCPDCSSFVRGRRLRRSGCF